MEIKNHKIKREDLIKKYLVQDVRTLDAAKDNDDFPPNFSSLSVDREFSFCNQYSLLTEFSKVKDRCKVIVEIGVARLSTNRMDDTSTTVFINNKKDDTIYIGIDIDDKKFLEESGPNIHTIQSKSENYEYITEKFKEIGIEKIDFLFIDGWHSINQVIDESFYFGFLDKGSVIGFHDTNYHPGPHKVIRNLNPEIFETRLYCESPNDWGVGFAFVI
jgi:hypothetical protein